ncbi:MAG: hypothetical protein AAF957_19070 [Planctomycetota bacterium]
MTSTTLALAAILALAPPAQVADERPQADTPAPDGPAAELADLQQRLEDAGGSFPETYAVFKAEFEAFAAKYTDREAGLTAKLWLLQQCWWQREDGTMETNARKRADAILAEHPDSKQLARMAEYQYVFSAKDRTEVLTKLRSSPHAEVRGYAIYELAKREKPEARETMLKLLLKEYADVPCRLTTFGALAEAHLNPHPPEALKNGQPAPEILGTDVDGNPMKLSDYRGKVVVLDFWGHW